MIPERPSLTNFLGRGFRALRAGLSRLTVVLYAVLRSIKTRELDYRAMSLVYTSLLALVPLLAVTFSILKTFGAHTQLEPLLLEIFEPLGDDARTVTSTMLASVQQLKVGVLGFVGFLSLFYTSVWLLEKIEESFNHIWRTRTSRHFMRRLGDYLSVTLGGPLVVFLAFGGMSGFVGRRNYRQNGLLGDAFQALDVILPYVFIIGAFMLAYRFIPNTRVKTRSALFGAVIAGLSWKLAGWLFAEFVANSTQYHAVYSSFAIPILFMIWLYVSWLILLLGVQISYFYQNPQQLAAAEQPAHPGHYSPERSGVAAMYLIGRNFYLGKGPLAPGDLAAALALPIDETKAILQVLEQNGLTLALGADQEGFIPARDLSVIRLAEVVSAFRGGWDLSGTSLGDSTKGAQIGRLLDRAEAALQATFADCTLRDLIAEDAAEISNESVTYRRKQGLA